MENLENYDDYDHKNGDQPEQMAYREYGATDFYWPYLLFNKVVNPFHHFPKDQKDLNKYIEKKHEGITLFLSDSDQNASSSSSSAGNTLDLCSFEYTSGEIVIEKISSVTDHAVFSNAQAEEDMPTDTITLQDKVGFDFVNAGNEDDAYVDSVIWLEITPGLKSKYNGVPILQTGTVESFDATTRQVKIKENFSYVILDGDDDMWAYIYPAAKVKEWDASQSKLVLEDVAPNADFSPDSDWIPAFAGSPIQSYNKLTFTNRINQFIVGEEIVGSGDGTKSFITAYNDANNYITLGNIQSVSNYLTRLYAAGETITGQTSGATAQVVSMEHEILDSGSYHDPTYIVKKVDTKNALHHFEDSNGNWLDPLENNRLDRYVLYDDTTDVVTNSEYEVSQNELNRRHKRPKIDRIRDITKRFRDEKFVPPRR